MRLKNDFLKDQLDRKQTAIDYVNFINTLQGNHTIALDAPWGSGKSTFIDFMTKELDKNKDLYITYNAWENDYTDDPFLSLMSNFFEQLEEKKYVEKDKLQSIITSAWDTSIVFGKGLIKGAGNLIIGNDAVKELSDNLEELLKGAIKETSNDIANKAFNNINKNKKTRDQFTRQLQETTAEIIKENEKEKIIIIIDELDRCKPTFAINLLENIKHLFSIDEIIFVIATDRKQLAESIKAVYGSGFDANTYLDRFFDVDLHLSKKLIGNYFNSKCQSLFDTHSDADINKISIALNLTIRDLEQIIYETLLLKTINKTKDFSPNTCIMLLILKYKIPNFYQEFKLKKYNNINEFMKEKNLVKNIDSNSDNNVPIERLIFVSTFVWENQNDRVYTYELKPNVYETIDFIESTL